MNIWFVLDQAIYDSAGKVMETVRFLRINQKRFILLASLAGNMLFLLAIRNAVYSYGEVSQVDLTVIATALTAMVCLGTLVDLVGNALSCT